MAVVLKKDQRTGKRTIGQVQWILTSAAFHSRGIKVMLASRQVGRVQEILNENTEVKENDWFIVFCFHKYITFAFHKKNARVAKLADAPSWGGGEKSCEFESHPGHQ